MLVKNFAGLKKSVSCFCAIVVLPVLVMSCAQTNVPAPAYAPEVNPESIVTPGSRSSEGAISDNSIDRLLNEPSRVRKGAIPPPEDRPGLATGWGESVRSDLHYTSFNRASSKPYGGVSSIYYNDREGVNAMTGWKATASRMQKAAGGLVEWGVSSGTGLLRNYHGAGRRFVVGKKGKSYTLVVKNLAKSRLEVVLSVDGLDVSDGKTASYKKRGYIVGPGETLKVKGWRKSAYEVAAFKFSSVAGSYSNLRHGESRNVGVIGLAVFTEKGVDPWTWMPHEVSKRKTASPFAEPPVYGVR